MSRRFLVVAGFVLAVFCVGSAATAAEPMAAEPTAAEGESSAATGEISGLVTAADGLPVGRVLISLSGPGGSALAVSDADGRFSFGTLAPGGYLLRTHLTRGAGGRRFVRIGPDESVFESLVLQNAGDGTRDLQFAGVSFGAAPASLRPADDSYSHSAAGAPDADPSGEPAPGEAASTARTSPPHAHDAKAWRLRRARRSVLKDRTSGPIVALPDELASAAGTGAAGEWALGRQESSSGRPLSQLVGLPISGEVQFLARATLTGPNPLWAPDAWPGQVAYVSVAPAGGGDWAVQGTVDMRSGENASWAVAGWYAAVPHDDHSVQVAMSYSKQAYAGASELLLDAPLRSVNAGLPDREVGSIEALDTWDVSPLLIVDYGAEFARYGYLEDGKLFSPRANVTIVPVDDTRIRAGVSQEMTAPGAEQFLPPLEGAWLPPERTFTSLSGFDDLEAERTRHVEVGVERDLGDSTVIGVRRFRQDVGNQLVAMFTPGLHVPVGTLPAPGGHYYLASASGVSADGWGFTFGHEVTERVRADVGYSVVRATWTPGSLASYPDASATVAGPGFERFHDVTAIVAAEIPETSTRVVARCRINTAFAHARDDALTPGLDARFDVRVTQALPFSPLEGSSWELLVALRTLFHEQGAGASIYDEMLVVDPPRQFVGGLVVHF